MSNGNSPPTGPESPALTPSAFLEAMAAKINRLHNADCTPLVMRAIPLRSGKPGQVYGGFIYAILKDPRTRDSIDARIPEQLASQIEWNREAVFVGLLRYKSGRGEVKPEIRIDAVSEVGDRRADTKDALHMRWNAVIAKPKRDPGAALAVDRPQIAFITGANSVAIADVREQLKDAEEDISLHVVFAALNRPEEVTRAVRKMNGAHLIVLARGGGPEVHDLDTDELIEAVATCPIPVITALGHANDRLVLDRVADASFPAPTAFGVWLRNRIDQKRAEARHIHASEELKRTTDLWKQVNALKGENDSLRKDVEQTRQRHKEADSTGRATKERLSEVHGENRALQKELVRLKDAETGQARWRLVACVLGSVLGISVIFGLIILLLR